MHRFSNISRFIVVAAGVAVAGFGPQALLAQSATEFTDLSGYSMEAPAIKSLVAQGILVAAAPGKFDPSGSMKRTDFAIAIQKMFNLPQPADPPKLGDVHPTDPFYAAAEAVAPYMDKSVPCSGCNVGTRFEPNKSVSRALWAMTLARVLIAQKKLTLLSDEETDKVLATVPDSKDFPQGARAYFATVISNHVMECCAGNVFDMDQMPSRADVADILSNVQQKFNIPTIKPAS